MSLLLHDKVDELSLKFYYIFGDHVFKNRHFKFEMAWCFTESFDTLIQEWWDEPQLEGWSAFIISKKN